MNEEVIEALKGLEREKEIPFETLIEGLEDALASAYKREFRDIEGARVHIDPVTGEMTLWEQELDEEENVLSETKVDDVRDFGRIAAQTAKQVILQRIREVSRNKVFDEFSKRVGELITGTIQQGDHRHVLVELGKVEGQLPPPEQTPTERYEHGVRMKFYIKDVRDSGRGPEIILSRTHSGLLSKLFELEVPEINDKYVEIMAAVREPGFRSKIAVRSRDASIDPVGACVGPRGSRVRMVVNELKGEKIDIIPWNEDPALFVANALSPAKVKEVIVDEDEKIAEVIVPDAHLSLAIGKEGQNARLAARLTGWRIDIKGDTQAREEEGILDGEVFQEAGVDGAGEAEAPAAEVEEGRCAAKTASGKPCPNLAKEGSRYCGLPAHQKQAEGGS